MHLGIFAEQYFGPVYYGPPYYSDGRTPGDERTRVFFPESARRAAM